MLQIPPVSITNVLVAGYRCSGTGCTAVLGSPGRAGEQAW